MENLLKWLVKEIAMASINPEKEENPLLAQIYGQQPYNIEEFPIPLQDEASEYFRLPHMLKELFVGKAEKHVNTFFLNQKKKELQKAIRLIQEEGVPPKKAGPILRKAGYSGDVALKAIDWVKESIQIINKENVSLPITIRYLLMAILLGFRESSNQGDELPPREQYENVFLILGIGLPEFNYNTYMEELAIFFETALKYLQLFTPEEMGIYLPWSKRPVIKKVTIQ